jgi:hypothetical protein
VSKPYSKDGNIFTFGVHGTENTPDNIRQVSGRISQELGKTTDGANLWDNGFDWRARQGGRGHPAPGTAHLHNGVDDRRMAAERLEDYVVNRVVNAAANNRIAKGEPLVVNLVGFSHGGNVSLQAAAGIAEELKERGFKNVAIHVNTLSTPAYNQQTGHPNWGWAHRNESLPNPENPANVRRQVEALGVRFAHTHLGIEQDGVATAARGEDRYGNNGVTRQQMLPALHNDLNPVDRTVKNHGLLQDNPGYMQRAADFMEGRFNGLAPPKTRAAAETSEGIAVATANIGDRPQVGTPTLVADAQPGQRLAGIEPFRPGNGSDMLDVINDRYFNLDGRQVANPYGERMQEMLKQLETPQFSPERNRDNVAALMEAAVAGKFKLDEPIQVGVGSRDNLFAMQGNGDAANRVAVSLSDTNGAYQRFSEAVVARAQEQVQAPQVALAQAPVQETEQRRATMSV